MGRKTLLSAAYDAYSEVYSNFSKPLVSQPLKNFTAGGFNLAYLLYRQLTFPLFRHFSRISPRRMRVLHFQSHPCCMVFDVPGYRWSKVQSQSREQTHRLVQWINRDVFETYLVYSVVGHLTGQFPECVQVRPHLVAEHGRAVTVLVVGAPAQPSS